MMVTSQCWTSPRGTMPTLQMVTMAAGSGAWRTAASGPTWRRQPPTTVRWFCGAEKVSRIARPRCALQGASPSRASTSAPATIMPCWRRAVMRARTCTTFGAVKRPCSSCSGTRAPSPMRASAAGGVLSLRPPTAPSPAGICPGDCPGESPPAPAVQKLKPRYWRSLCVSIAATPTGETSWACLRGPPPQGTSLRRGRRTAALWPTAAFSCSTLHRGASSRKGHPPWTGSSLPPLSGNKKTSSSSSSSGGNPRRGPPLQANL
mmetsp:Transcript_16759/g.50069  ORF Transcript_16759/g.50069 Transcript_16759/m.50069 type:complete len:262 (-) Transcript_16759:701-1486(-)